MPIPTLTEDQVESISEALESAVNEVFAQFGLEPETDHGLLRVTWQDEDGEEYTDSFSTSLGQG